MVPSNRKGTPVAGTLLVFVGATFLLETLRTRLHPGTPAVSVLQADLGVPAFLHRLTAASTADVTSEGVGGGSGGGRKTAWGVKKNRMPCDET